MTHKTQFQFMRCIKEAYPAFFTHKIVGEIGSLNINGSIREFFTDCQYTGYDVQLGNGVDVACQGQMIDQPTGYFDILLSCECFEHNPYWVETFANMLRMLKSDGMMVISCATTGRPEHGTSDSDLGSSPLTVGLGWNYYHNLTPLDFIERFNLNGWFYSYHFLQNRHMADLYLIGLGREWAPHLDNSASLLTSLLAHNNQYICGWTKNQGYHQMRNTENGNARIFTGTAWK